MACLFFSSREKKRSNSSYHTRHRYFFSWSFFGSHSSEQEHGNIEEMSRSAPPSFVQHGTHPDRNSAKDDDGDKAIINDNTSAGEFLHGPEAMVSFKTPMGSPKREPRGFPFLELRNATQNFSHANLLGEGGFGCVFKGAVKLEPSGSELIDIAVKQLNVQGHQGHKEWLAEVRFLGYIEHPNVVKLIGYCADENERGTQRLLVYEYMANRSMERHLFSKNIPVLSWQNRLNIMLGAAQGLAYLHDNCQVIFRDFKTSNILLDEKFRPKLSDFGLAREGPEVGRSHVSTSVVGTIGYAAPEYIQTGHLTIKSDVWSFGVVLLEIISGRRSVDRNRPKNEQNLLEWARPYVYRSKQINFIMDPRLQGMYSHAQAVKVTELALQCLNRFPRERPAMTVVVKSLQAIIQLPKGERNKQDFIPGSPIAHKERIRIRRRHNLLEDLNILRFGKAVQA